MKSSAGTVLVTRAAAWLLIDFRYVEEAEAKVKNCTVLEQKNLFAQAASLLRESGVKRLSVLSSRLTVSRFREMAARLPDVALDASGALDRLLASLRAHKCAEEAGWHREAQRITDETFTHICGLYPPRPHGDRDRSGDRHDAHTPRLGRQDVQLHRRLRPQQLAAPRLCHAPGA